MPEPAPDADLPLIPLAQRGDHAAFTELVNRHYPTCLKLARSILGDHGDAEDEVQNAWTKAYLHLAGFEGQSRFSTWMSRIVVNQCLMRLRRPRFAYLESPPEWSDGPVFEPPDPAPNPEQELSRRELSRLVNREVRRIPPLLRQPLLLHETLPIAEVARRLEISEPAAKSRMLRARQELRGRLNRHGGAAALLR